MYWTTPTLVEICIGLEINGYLPAEFGSELILLK
jgi:coenzyme PQQ precursor peptide PqqA